jgi:hypothetical protein
MFILGGGRKKQARCICVTSVQSTAESKEGGMESIDVLHVNCSSVDRTEESVHVFVELFYWLVSHLASLVCHDVLGGLLNPLCG